jgi:chemotaxis protein methyltransferase CheR
MVITNNDIEFVINTIKTISHYDFSEYSIKSFTRRIEKILIDYKLEIPTFIDKIKTQPLFLEKVVKDITVNTTELFRDPMVWQNLRYRVIPKLLEKSRINIWHAGCSTGQEVYSMLILLNEMNLLDRSNIFASDLNTDVIETAKKGEYVYRFNIEYLENFNQVIRQNPYNFDEFYDVPYSKYFDIDKVKDILSIKPFLLKKVVYKKHDLVKEGNAFNNKFDLIMCRNVLIYFNNDLQNHIFDLFYDCLYSKGTLVLGIHESILGPKASKFNKKGLVYIKKD